MADKKKMIPVAKPWLGMEEAAAVQKPILSGWVTQGPEVAAFEREFAAHIGAAHACAVSSCTTALHLALRAVGVCAGDEVITVSHSYIATANAIRYCGAIPVFVDIDPVYFNMDAARIEQAITPKTKAILAVHQIGMPCDLERIVAIAKKHDLPVIEDAACAIGSEIVWDGNWEKIGRPHGEIACFSFHPRKLVTTGDGGMITTNNADWDTRFRRLRQHSMSVPDTVRHGSTNVVFEEYPELGYNYRMTDVQAAIGREQLRKLPQMLERRRSQAARYRELLADVDGLILPTEPKWARSNWQSFAVRLPDGADQIAVMQAMLDDGVSTRRGIMCSHREPAFADEPWSCASGTRSNPCPDLRQSESAQDRTILLPMFHVMTEAEQEQVAASLKRALAAQAARTKAIAR